ncbi:MAG: peptidoglycan DD-metalloendopeptidase family protein [Clostridia bacterium]|nr:peptidoglycan DD-metalloendopeptidase family protein [Clostridia bacterium]
MKKKKWIAVIAIVIVVAFLIMAVLPMATNFSASAANDISSKKNQLTSLASQKSKIQNEINAIKNDKSNEMAYKDKLEQEIALTEQEIKTLNALIADYETQISEKQTEIDELQIKLDNQIAQFKGRVRVMYEDGESSYLEVLLESTSYFAFLTRMEFVTSIMERDNRLIDDMKATSAQLKAAKAELETSLSETEDAKAQIVEKQQELQQRSAESQAIIDKLTNDEAYLKEQYSIAEKEANQVQAEIDRILAEQKKTQAAKEYVGGVFGWPLPGYSTISSPFGMRFHPTLKVYKLHTGVDLPAPKGTKIVAANAGTVITSTRNGAYGNYVVIDHGGGRTTLYAHMSSRSVSTGQTVTKGQQVGTVGSTGYATGNHLHFEIRINGSLVNPMSYFK